MNTYLISIKRRVEKLFKHKIFRYALALHIFYFISSIVIFFTIFQEGTDFKIFYDTGKKFINDIENLYNQAYILRGFRYFPLSAIFFVPFSLLDFQIAFLVFNVSNLVINFLICFLLYKICVLVKYEDHETDDKRVIFYVCIYLMGLPHLFNYVAGQMNLYVTCLILYSLYLFLKYEDLKWQFLASLILGISIIIKPTGFLIIPFLIILNIDLKKMKVKFDSFKSITRLIGVITPVLLNFILFFLYPTLWDGFLDVNFTRSNRNNPSPCFSVTQLITNFFYIYNISFNHIILLLGMIGIIGGIGFIIFTLKSYEKNSIIYGYAFGIIIMLLAYFDTQDPHLLTLTPILIIIIFNFPRYSRNTNPIKFSLYFLNFFDLIFVGIWHVTYLLVPYNFESTFFLILAFYGIGKLYNQLPKSTLEEVI